MATPDLLRRCDYDIGEVIYIDDDEQTKGRISSVKEPGDTYIVEIEGSWYRVNDADILGSELTTEEKLKNLEGHMTKVLLDLQKCIQENKELREIAANASLESSWMLVDRDAALKRNLELEIKNEMLEKHCSRMIKHILDFYCKEL